MEQRERQAFVIAASLFVALFLVWGGGVNTGPVFLPPLLKYFGWTRARVSTLGSAGALMGGACGSLVGWLVDRIEARKVMVLGALTVGAGFLIASRSNSYSLLLIAKLIIAIGVRAATLLPASLVIASWFGARRGFALGFTFAGTSLGGAAMIVVANKAIALGGWRAGYIAIALPMLPIVVPLVMFIVRSSPSSSKASADPTASAVAPVVIPGVELIQAFRTRSFWLISIAEFFLRLRDRWHPCPPGRLPDWNWLYGDVVNQAPEPDLLGVNVREGHARPISGSAESAPGPVIRLFWRGGRHDPFARCRERFDDDRVHCPRWNRSGNATGVATAGVYPVARFKAARIGAGCSGNLLYRRRGDRSRGGGTNLRCQRQLWLGVRRVRGDVVRSGLGDIRMLAARGRTEAPGAIRHRSGTCRLNMNSLRHPGDALRRNGSA
jgi:hypothetical protein